MNGEDTTIGISDAGFNGTPAVGLYVNNSYTDEYISAMGDHFDATATDTATVIVTDQAAEGLSDVTLKNGIVTIDATADKTYVTADEFNSYIVGRAALQKWKIWLWTATAPLVQAVPRAMPWLPATTSLLFWTTITTSPICMCSMQLCN